MPPDAASLLGSGGVALPSDGAVTLHGADPVLGSRHRVGEAAASAIGAAAAWAAGFGELRGFPAQSVDVDVRPAAAGLVGFALQSAATDISRQFSAVTALFPTADDRLIHLHGGFPHLERGTTELLGCRTSGHGGHRATVDGRAVAAAVANWPADALEDALADAGLCGAVVRGASEWAAHPQGAAVVDLPVVRTRRVGDAPPRAEVTGRGDAGTTAGSEQRPLSGVRVLDLTRVLAGPTAGRTLAAHGAEVLRVDGTHTPTIEAFEIETSWGKRRAVCDLRDPVQREALLGLAVTADVVVQGYRTGALEGLGLGADDLVARAPGLVVARLNCYGPHGPWAERRGWEQLAQSASGIAVAENPLAPRLIPAAATDYTTGHLLAAGVTEALYRQRETGGSWLVEGSLCQTASWLTRLGADLDPDRASGLDDLAPWQEEVPTPWGPVTHLGPEARLSHTPPRWDLPPSRRGSSNLAWAV